MHQPINMITKKERGTKNDLRIFTKRCRPHVIVTVQNPSLGTTIGTDEQ